MCWSVKFAMGVSVHSEKTRGIEESPCLKLQCLWQSNGILKRNILLSDLQCTWSSSVDTKICLMALLMKEVWTLEMSVSFYQTTWPNIPEDCHLYAHRLENMKSQQSSCLSHISCFSRGTFPLRVHNCTTHEGWIFRTDFQPVNLARKNENSQ